MTDLSKPRKHFLLQFLKWIALSLLIIVALFILLPNFFKMPIDDENIYIYQGLLVSQGKIPYRDFFDFVTPGSFIINGLFIKLFGPTMVGLRLLALFCLITCSAITVEIGKKHVPKSCLIILSTLFWFIHIPITMQVSHHLFSATFGMGSIYLLLNSLKVRSKTINTKKYIVGGGVLCGLCLLCTQSLGGILLAGLSGFLTLYFYFSKNTSFIQSIKVTILLFILPALAPILLTGVWLLFNNALNDFWYSSVIWLFRGGYSETTSHWYFGEGFLKVVSPTASGDIYVAPFHELIKTLLHGWLPILGLVWGAQILWQQQKNNRTSWYFACLWLSAFLFIGAALSYPTRILVAYHGWPAYLLGIMAVHNLVKKNFIICKSIGIIFFILCLLWTKPLIYRASQMILLPSYMSFGTVEKQLTPLPWDTKEKIEWQNNIVTRIHEESKSKESFFVLNIEPQLYLLSDRHNPTRYQYLLHTYNTEKQILEAANDLKKALPLFIFDNNRDDIYFKYDRRFESLRHIDYQLKPIDEIIRNHYNLVAEKGRLKLYQRKKMALSTE